tara:strand:- start:7508 stop:8248 length:741 start_codon:yes stop_codon:yes gene_type:complete
MEFLVNYLQDSLPSITSITEKRMYFLSEETIIEDIKIYCTTESKSHRRQIIPFGLAKGSSQNKSTRGAYTFITLIEDGDSTKKRKFQNLEDDFKLTKVHRDDAPIIIDIIRKEKEEIKQITKKNGFVMRAAPDKYMQKATRSLTKSAGYVAPNSKVTGNHTLIIKNIPAEADRQEVYQYLEKTFSKYGMINKINVLRHKTDSSKLYGFAFIDFFYSATADKILQLTTRFSIGHSILSIGRSIKKTK